MSTRLSPIPTTGQLVERHQFPAAANDNLDNAETTAKRGQRKSRNGCITCKSKRRKCDETKPFCLRCRYQNIACGGYDQGIKWRPVKIPSLVRKKEKCTRSANKRTDNVRQITQSLRPNESNEALAVENDAPVQGDMTTDGQEARTSRGPESFAWRPTMGSSSGPTQRAIPGLNSETLNNTDLFAEEVFDDLNLEDFDPSHFDTNALADLSYSHLFGTVSLGVGVLGTSRDTSLGSHVTPQLDTWYSRLENAVDQSPENVGQNGSERAQIQQPASPIHREAWKEITQDLSGLDSIRRDKSLEPGPSPSNTANTTASASPYRQLDPPDDSPEEIRTLFNLHTCRILSIRDGLTDNPWIIYIWPLAHGCPALYHALAAMTYFHVSARDPRLYDLGLKHFRCSTDAIASSDDYIDISPEAAIATRLALGFSEMWNPQRPSTGIAHINGAKTLIQRVIADHRRSEMTADQIKHLSFLTSTWLYMDVFARFSCSAEATSTNEELEAAIGLLNPAPVEQHLDHLMGCASTLFPMIGRMADLVNHAREANNKSNPLDLISKATNLKRGIERWTPLIDVNKSGEQELCIADSIQTAEAYRWALLLLLRQTVPEIPWSHSQLELAQKTLVYLATIPIESPVAILHVFPLLVAGVEVTEEENRAWIRRRFEYMSNFMAQGRVERCHKLLEEVWRRRDVFEEQHELRGSFPTQGISSEVAGSGASQNDSSTAISHSSFRSQLSKALKLRSLASDFPDSLAFKKGIDPVTRSGYKGYTVRGHLHWLAVMKEWGWEVMLG
ncbi:hypothetical protein Plec18170_000608 [Paecilomyces lecythidis]